VATTGRAEEEIAMKQLAVLATILILLSVCGTATAAGPAVEPPPTPAAEPFLLGPPTQAGPVVVRIRFDLQDIIAINDGAETFEFVGVLTLVWRDPRQAFDPAAAGIEEKIFQGAYQVDEVSTGWFPQVVLVNAAGVPEADGVLLRVQPDGTSTLVTKLNATAESEFVMRRFPFDQQRLQAVFEVLGFDADEVVLQTDGESAGALSGAVRIPQWELRGIDAAVTEGPAAQAGPRASASRFVWSVDVKRESWFVRRLIVLPLIVIVLLSFSVFWMDRSSLGDRLSVSFIGILTCVAYQLVTSDHLPPIAYVTVIHGFLNLSFLTMCATVVVNLVVGAVDARGDSARGDRIDRRCRWAFPLGYFGVILTLLAVEFLLD
jgi:hypothetical protein